jgi:hypothetical protein
LDDVGEEIGRFLIPVVGDFVDTGTPLVKILRRIAEEADNVGFNIGKTRFSFQNFISVVAKKAFLGPFALFTTLGEEVEEVTDEVDKATTALNNLRYAFKLPLNETQKQFQLLKENIKKNKEETKGATKETENYADTLKSKMKDALIQARAEVTKATDDFKAFQTSISQSFTKDLSFTSAEEAGKETGQGYIDGLVSQAQKIKTFGELTNRLISAGISEQALQQVLSAGLDAGTKIAQTLIDGGSDAITGPDGINQVVASVQTMADQIGLNAANNWYKSGVDNAKSYLTGVKKVLDSIDLSKIKSKRDLRLALKSITAALEVPALAEGGITTGPTLALIGDNPGGREAVIPLDRMNEFGGGSNVTINVNGGDPQAVVDALRRYMYQNGTVPIRVSG